MLERIKHEKTVDIYGHVTLMRSQRNYMVQTEDQYSFIHDALLEAVACGNTEVAARSLYSYIQKLAQVESGEHVTGMELEFKVQDMQEIRGSSILHFCKDRRQPVGTQWSTYLHQGRTVPLMSINLLLVTHIHRYQCPEHDRFSHQDQWIILWEINSLKILYLLSFHFGSITKCNYIFQGPCSKFR